MNAWLRISLLVFLGTLCGNVWSQPLLLQDEDLLAASRRASLLGDMKSALEYANQAIMKNPENANAYYVRGRLYESLKDYEKAIADYDVVVKMQPEASGVYQRRGEAQFKQGNFLPSLADFDRFLRMAPGQRPHHWQRGIVLYYAGFYEEGYKQFELHQTVNSQDVENAVWHMICLAKIVGVEKAREQFIAITSDRRVPLKEIHALFAGKGSEQAVLDRIAENDPPYSQDQFYGYFYLGLYFEMMGDFKKSEEYIRKSAFDIPSDHYMGDVARVHARWLEKKKADAPPSTPSQVP